MKETKQQVVIASWGAMMVYAALAYGAVSCIQAALGNLPWFTAIWSTIGGLVFGGVTCAIEPYTFFRQVPEHNLPR